MTIQVDGSQITLVDPFHQAPEIVVFCDGGLVGYDGYKSSSPVGGACTCIALLRSDLHDQCRDPNKTYTTTIQNGVVYVEYAEEVYTLYPHNVTDEKGKSASVVTNSNTEILGCINAVILGLYLAAPVVNKRQPLTLVVACDSTAALGWLGKRHQTANVPHSLLKRLVKVWQLCIDFNVSIRTIHVKGHVPQYQIERGWYRKRKAGVSTGPYIPTSIYNERCHKKTEIRCLALQEKYEQDHV